MKAKGIHLTWIVVKDLTKAIEFYTKTVGLTLRESHPEYGWAELSGSEGSLLGLAQESSQMDYRAGINGIITITVIDLEAARLRLLDQKAKCVGDVIEIPHHVKMQTFIDQDGNTLQLVEPLSK